MCELASVVEIARQHRLDHVLPQIVLDQRLGAIPVLGGDQHLLDLHRVARRVADRDLGLPVGAQVGHDLGLADVGETLGELVGQRDRQRHQLVGLVAGVAEHHSLVAGAGQVELVVVAGVGAGLVCLVDALGDVRGLLVDRVDDRAGLVVEAELGVGVADPLDVSRAISWMST